MHAGLACFDRLRRAMTIHISSSYGGGCDPVWQPVEKCTPGLACFDRLRRAIAIHISSGYGGGCDPVWQPVEKCTPGLPILNASGVQW
ncbi:hypothetical protein [Bianquea renquensis]|uniref:Uncharacterized protein n=1 Tax=Bianquea renquensis TaxID=2763661 RepID=A0A926DQF9_9FIRM|nr:hypothetical protein [Bianquea renquensis]MBC8543310.1 hypothetical protein [Bianquea renquensis]